MLGVRPLLGRLLPEQPANSTIAEPVVVISYDFWQREYAGDPAVLGQTLRFRGVPLAIIGVTPRGTPSLGVELTPDFTVLQSIYPQAYREPATARIYYIVGRLRPTMTLEAAQARLDAIWPGIQRAAVSTPGAPATRYMRDLHEIRLESAAHGFSPLRTRYDRPLRLLVGLAAIVLLVACLNLGALLLARAVVRQGELAIHLALGATRARIARQLLAEGAVLATFGTIAAVPLAFWISRTLVALIWNGPVPITMPLAPDARIFIGMAVGGWLCGLIVSAPALAFWLTRPERASGQMRTVLAGTGWMGKSLVVCQLALTLALLFAAGLFFKNLAQLRAIDPGYRTRGIAWMRLNELPGRAPIADPVSYSRELIAQLSRLPGVSAVALSNLFPTASASRPSVVSVRVVGALPDAAIKASPEYASTEFFTLTGIGLIEGRLFTPVDDATHPPVAVINATLAHQLFPDGHALGQRIQFEGTPAAAPQAEVVGIVRDASPGDVRIARQPMFYRPIFQEPAFLRVPVVSIRAEDPGSLSAPVRRVIASFDQHYPWEVNILQDTLERALITERTLTDLSAFVGGLGLLLASLGLYALLAYTIGRRHRELGLRMALGASGPVLVRMVIRDALVLLGLGLAIGVPAAIGVGQLAGAMLFGLSGADPITLVATTLVLVAAVFLALAGPARRVAGIEPAVALRAD
jgi:predicted permease